MQKFLVATNMLITTCDRNFFCKKGPRKKPSANIFLFIFIY